MRFMAILSISLAIGLAGCSQVAEKAENVANRSYTSYALGKPYTEVANLGQSPMARLSGSEATFGPMIGATPLKNGMTIYRHMAPGAQTETGANFAGLVGSSTVSQNNRLSYFLVGADGIGPRAPCRAAPATACSISAASSTAATICGSSRLRSRSMTSGWRPRPANPFPAGANRPHPQSTEDARQPG